jgi:gliding motility-associated protein GldM
MSESKLSNRQKMINMMYLVLIAMLALNVSAEILKAFYLVEHSMVKSSLNIDSRNNLIIEKFKAGMKHDPIKTKPYYDKALKAQEITVDLVNYIKQLKSELEGQTRGREAEGEFKGQLVGRDDMDKHVFTLVSEQGPHKGELLKKRINMAREQLLALVDAKDRNYIVSANDLKALDDPDRKPQTWESELFENAPLAAVVTLLQKIENDAKNTEAEVMSYLATQIYDDMPPFDNLKAVVSAKSSVVLAGEPYEAEIYVAASSSSLVPEVTLNGAPLKVEGGIAKYISNASEGSHSFQGNIRVKKPNGEIITLPFKDEYMGFKGAATVSSDAMNLFYAGPENPVSISVPGFPSEQVQVKSSVGIIQPVSGQNGKYIVKINEADAGKPCIITTTVKTKEGQIKPMGATTFRVRKTPSPRIYIGSVRKAAVGKAELAAQKGVVALLDESNVVNYKYIVKQYKYAYLKRDGSITIATVYGDQLPNDLIDQLKSARKNETFGIYEIKYQLVGGDKERFDEAGTSVTIK